MNKILKGLTLFIVTGSVSSSLMTGLAENGARVATTTICGLAKNSPEYSKRLVRVRAFVLTDLIHSTILVDSTCNNVGVSLESEEFEDRPIGLVKDKNYEELEELRPKISVLTQRGQRVYGTFEGLFEWHSDRPHGPIRTLVFRQVSNLHVGVQDDPKYDLQN